MILYLGFQFSEYEIDVGELGGAHHCWRGGVEIDVEGGKTDFEPSVRVVRRQADRHVGADQRVAVAVRLAGTGPEVAGVERRDLRAAAEDDGGVERAGQQGRRRRRRRIGTGRGQRYVAAGAGDQARGHRGDQVAVGPAGRERPEARGVRGRGRGDGGVDAGVPGRRADELPVGAGRREDAVGRGESAHADG